MCNWIEWSGGECPVLIGTPVDVRHRDGDIFFAENAGNGAAHDWDNDNVGGDIVAYRVHSKSILDAAPELLEALTELVTDMVIAQGNMRDAAKHDPRWEGCADAIQPRIDAARAAISKARGN